MSLNPKYRYIVVEGPIGSGKTTLAKKLATHLGAATLFEDPDANPFLPGFYQDPARHALPVQLFFLFQRSNQVRDLVQSDLFRGITVADFMLEKDPLFAQMNLNDAELALYRQIYDHLKPQAPEPDLVIYLQAGVETLIERVRRRSTSYERTIPDDYLLRLADTYARYFHHYESSPLLIVNSDNLNFVDSPADFDLLLQRINALRGPREFFSLGS
jgi:deoxyadenosine/deoxycytidine kinase